MELKQRRELYKAMRSAHDGICPLCGKLLTIGVEYRVEELEQVFKYLKLKDYK